MKHLFLFIALTLLVVGCATTPTATPQPAPTAVPPTALPQPTTVPTATALPPTPTAAPTDTPAPPTNTPIPTTPAPTATNTRPAVTRAPATATVPAVPPTATQVAVKFAAPELIEPHAGQTRRAGQENLVFSWKPVGALGGNECYLVNVTITNTVDNNSASQAFIASDSCGNPGDTPQVKFTLDKRSPAPDYAGLLAIANNPNQGNNFNVTWTVTVIQNNGADPNKPDPSQYVPLSPTSAPLEFTLQG